MKNEMNTLSPLSKSIALALGATVISPVMAQDSDSGEDAGMMEEVIITGVRRSLINSVAVKRDSDGVVDAISSEDIGKFPDTNLAEAMSRITGVSIDRNSPGGAAGEGQRVTVRGIGPDFNLVLLNGRQMPGATLEDTGASNSRAFDFSNIASEAVSAVEVYKTSMANLPTGGIGATINIRTARPLDIGERSMSFGAKAVTDSSAESSKWTPEVSGIYSDVFADGKFGITVSAIYQKRDFGYNQARIEQYRFCKGDDAGCWGAVPQPGAPGSENIVNRPGPDDLYGIPQNLRYSLNEVERERLNGQLVLQWRPIETVTATLDYTYSELEIQTRRSETSSWFNFGASGSEFTDGPIATPVTYTEFKEDFAWDRVYDQAKYGQKTKNNSIGFNLEWLATDNLAFTLDYHDSTAKIGSASPYGTNALLSGVAFHRGTSTVDLSQDFPVLTVDLPGGVMDPSTVLTGGYSFRDSYMKSEVEQLDLSGVFDFGEAMSLDFGVTMTEVNNRTAFGKNENPAWGGVGSPDDYPDDLFQIRDISSAFDAIPGHANPNLTNEMFIWDFDRMVPIASAARDEYLGKPDAFTDDRRVKEKSKSAYLQYLWNFDIGSMNSNLRAGIRYEKTDVTSSALVPIATAINWVSSNEYTIVESDPGFTELDGKYNYWLPNLDFNIEVAENVILRASYSKTLGRPQWNEIQGGQTLRDVRINGGTGTQGNPGLLPLESNNYDLSFEWYYSEGSYVSVGYFRKDVSNYIGTTTVQGTPFDLPHPSQGAWFDEANAATGGQDDPVLIRQYILETYGDSQYVEVTGVDSVGNLTGNIFGQPGDDIAVFDIGVPSNQRDAEIDGWEFAVQHLFGQSGFGVIANYTKVDSDIPFDNKSLDSQFGVIGLSDSANLVAFYDKNGWIARLAYNWRDEFLSSASWETTNPLYTEKYAQLDAIVSYTFQNGITLFAEGFNLTDEYVRVRTRASEQTAFVTQTGPRYGLGVRWTY